jgi:hypothetical protein
MKSILLALVLGLGLLVAAGGAARAQSVEPPPEIYEVRCFAKAEVIEVRRLEVTPETVREVVARHDEALAARNHLYIPGWHAHLDVKPSAPGYGIEPKPHTCPSHAGRVELLILPEPLFKQLSISVTLSVAGRLIVDDLPFDVCQSGGGIVRMRFNGKDASLTFWGAFSGHTAQARTPVDPVDDRQRRFVIEPAGIRTLDQWALRWTVRDRPLVHIDIDYVGSGYDSSHFHQRGSYLGACRYVGPGMPDSRWRDEDWEFRASGSNPGRILVRLSP